MARPVPARACPNASRPPANEAEPGDNQADAGEAAEHHAPGFVDPLVVEGVLQEEADAEQQDEDAGVEQAAAADAAFEIRCVGCAGWRSVHWVRVRRVRWVRSVHWVRVRRVRRLPLR